MLRAFSVINACVGVGLSGKPLKLSSWRCTQPRAAKARADVAVVDIDTEHCSHRMIHAAGGWSYSRNAPR